MATHLPRFATRLVKWLVPAQDHDALLGDITEEARVCVMKTLDSLSGEEKTDYGMVKEKVRVDLKRLIQKSTGRRPLIMPVILEI